MANQKKEEVYRSKISRTRGDKVFDAVCAVMMVALCLIVAYPIWFVIIASFSGPYYITTEEVLFAPKGVSLNAYKLLLQRSDVWIGYRNSIFYTVVGTCLNMIVTLPAAYALSRKELAGRRWIMLYFTFTMFFNGGIIPLYRLIGDMNLLNNMWGLILPTTLSVYNMTIARAFFQGSIPDGIVEAAQIDGCSNIGTFFRIVLPVSPAIISVMCLFHVVFRWNEYFNAMMFFTDVDLYPLQLVLRDILINNTMTSQSGSGSDAQAIVEMRRQAQLIKYSSIVVSTVPMLILYPFLQKYFVKGIMVGSLKG